MPKRELIEELDKSKLSTVIYLKCFNRENELVYDLSGLQKHSRVKELGLKTEDLLPSHTVAVKSNEGGFGKQGYYHNEMQKILVLNHGWLLLFLLDVTGERGKAEVIDFKTMPSGKVETGFLFPTLYIPPGVAHYVYNPFNFDQSLTILSRMSEEEAREKDDIHELNAIGGNLEMVLKEIEVEFD